MGNRISNLSTILLFADLKHATLEQLDLISQVTSFDDNQIIMVESDVETPVYIILEGIVRIYRTNMDGREQTLISLHSGDAFNVPTAFFKHNITPASAVTVGFVKLLSINQTEFRRIVYECPDLAKNILEDFAERLNYLTNLVHNISLRSVRGRLAHFLITQATQPSVMNWTQEEIAAQIGTTREVINRTMRLFIQEKLIKRDRHRIIIINQEALGKEAEG